MTVPVSAQRMDCTDCICMNRAFNMTACLYWGKDSSCWTAQAQRRPLYYEHCPVWAGSRSLRFNIIPLPMLLPAREEGVTALTQIFTQTPPGSPVFHLSAAVLWSTHTYILPACVWTVCVDLDQSQYMCNYHTAGLLVQELIHFYGGPESSMYRNLRIQNTKYKKHNQILKTQTNAASRMEIN